MLQAIRANEKTRGLPVVVLPTSTEPFDVEASYALGVTSYISTPVDFEQFVWAVKQVGMYWLVSNHPREGIRRVRATARCRSGLRTRRLVSTFAAVSLGRPTA